MKILTILFTLICFASIGQTISSLPSATTLGGTEVVAGVQGGVTKKISINQIHAYVLGVGSFWPLAGAATLTANVLINGNQKFFQVEGADSIHLHADNGIDPNKAELILSSDFTGNGGAILQTYDGGAVRVSDGVNGNTLFDYRSGLDQNGWEYNSDYSAGYTDRSIVDKAYVDAQVGGISNGGSVNTFPPNIQTGNYTAQLGDTIRVVYMRHVSTAQTFEVPLDIFPIGAFLTVVRDSTNVVTLSIPVGGTFENESGSLTLAQDKPCVLHQKYVNGWEVWKEGASSGGGGHIIEEEGTPVTQRDTLNFVGASVTVTDAGGKSVVTITGGVDYTRNAVAISAGTLTLDINSLTLKNFDLTTTVSSAFTIAFSNSTNFVQGKLTLRVTGAVAITMPTAVIMDLYEEGVGRWVSSTNILTLTGTTASPFMMEFYSDGTNIWCSATNRGL